MCVCDLGQVIQSHLPTMAVRAARAFSLHIRSHQVTGGPVSSHERPSPSGEKQIPYWCYCLTSFGLLTGIRTRVCLADRDAYELFAKLDNNDKVNDDNIVISIMFMLIMIMIMLILIVIMIMLMLIMIMIMLMLIVIK